MGMFKQYRLWSVESAIANIEILKAQRLAKFPDRVTPPEIDLAALVSIKRNGHRLQPCLTKKREFFRS
jgi:hypothetical protein